MDIADNKKLEGLGLEFLSATQQRRKEICAAFSIPPSRNDKPIWDYIFKDEQLHFQHGGDPRYSRERCLNDLALLFILHDEELDPGLDPRDISSALAAILNKADAMDHAAVQAWFSEAAGIARSMGFYYLAKEMEMRPEIEWRSSSYRRRILEH